MFSDSIQPGFSGLVDALAIILYSISDNLLFPGVHDQLAPQNLGVSNPSMLS